MERKNSRRSLEPSSDAVLDGEDRKDTSEVYSLRIKERRYEGFQPSSRFPSSIKGRSEHFIPQEPSAQNKTVPNNRRFSVQSESRLRMQGELVFPSTESVEGPEAFGQASKQRPSSQGNRHSESRETLHRWKDPGPSGGHDPQREPKPQPQGHTFPSNGPDKHAINGRASSSGDRRLYGRESPHRPREAERAGRRQLEEVPARSNFLVQCFKTTYCPHRPAISPRCPHPLTPTPHPSVIARLSAARTEARGGSALTWPAPSPRAWAWGAL